MRANEAAIANLELALYPHLFGGATALPQELATAFSGFENYRNHVKYFDFSDCNDGTYESHLNDSSRDWQWLGPVV